MLGDHRIVDLTDERGNLASFILAGFGADVVLVEPPSGSGARRLGPFAGDVVDPERSLTFWGWNRGKRSAVLDLTTDEGQADLAALCAGADVVIESGAVPVDLAALRAANPALVTVSISPFGSTGPKAGWPGTDLTVDAASGHLLGTGDDDRAPLRSTAPQVFLHAGADAAAGALVALAERRASGLGQHVDISAQRSMMQATQSYSLAAALHGPDALRASGGIKAGPLNVQLRWPCQDGYVSITFLFGSSIGPFSARLMQWIHEEGFCDEATRDKDWIEYTAMLYDGREPPSEYERVKGIITDFCATKTKDELLQAACDRMLLIAPVTTPEDVVNSKQFAAREFFDLVDDDVISPDGPVTAPGPYAWPSTSAPIRLGRAPRLGEHTDAVRAAPWSPREAPATAATSGTRAAPFAGIKVLDMTWAMSGPATTRVMADFGAEVVRIENSRHLDVARTVGPFVNDVPGNDSSGLLFNMTTGKRSISVDLTTEGGRELLDDLIRWADVLIESYSPRGKVALGLETERVRALNPRLIMLSTCLFGQTGPLRRYAGFGTMGASLAGFFHLVGWPDRPPSGPFGAYSDYPSPRMSLCAILAALTDRERTGEGTYMDFAQAESCVHFLTPAILDQTVNGRTQNPVGNDDPHMSPHGVYRSAGEEQWIAIACRDDADWQALAGVLGRDDLAGLSLAERIARRDELNGVVEAWTAERPAGQAMHAVLAAGVPAHTVQSSGDCLVDPQLLHHDHFVELPHPEHGTITVENSRLSLSATPARVHGTPPFLGQDTVDVLTGMLGYDDDRLGELFAAGALD